MRRWYTRTTITRTLVITRGLPLEDSTIRMEPITHGRSCGLCFPASACLVGGAFKRSCEHVDDVAVRRSACLLGSHEDEGPQSREIYVACSECLPKNPSGAVSLDRPSGSSTRQECHPRRPHTSYVVHSEVGCSHNASRPHSQRQKPALPDDPTSGQLVGRQSAPTGSLTSSGPSRDDAPARAALPGWNCERKTRASSCPYVSSAGRFAS